MLQARPHAIHFKRILDFGEGQLHFPCAFLNILGHRLNLHEWEQTMRLDGALEREPGLGGDPSSDIETWSMDVAWVAYLANPVRAAKMTGTRIQPASLCKRA
jgi:hypothetical protein